MELMEHPCSRRAVKIPRSMSVMSVPRRIRQSQDSTYFRTSSRPIAPLVNSYILRMVLPDHRLAEESRGHGDPRHFQKIRNGPPAGRSGAVPTPAMMTGLRAPLMMPTASLRASSSSLPSAGSDFFPARAAGHDRRRDHIPGQFNIDGPLVP